MKKFAIVFFLLIPGLALADGGRILYVSGSVTVERSGKMYRAVKNARLIEGDRIETGRIGRLHLRMSDRTLVSLKPNSSFQIQAYRFTSQARKVSQRTEDRSRDSKSSSDRSVFRLLKGGFRAVTGLIGQRDKQAFGVNTPVATIGIRGTSFTADMTEQPDSSGTVAQILTMGVADGSIIVQNPQGTLVLENGEFGEVRTGQGPQRLLLGPADSEAQSASRSEDDDQSIQQDVTRVATRLLPPDKTQGVEYSTGEEFSTEDTEYVLRRNLSLASNLANVALSQTVAEAALELNDSGNVTALISAAGERSALEPVAIELVNGVVDNIGFDPDTSLLWGRWSGDSTIRVTDARGQAQDSSGQAVNLHLIQSVASNELPQMPMTGTRDFSLVGNTNPVSDDHSEGILGSASLSANFDTQSVSSEIALSIDQQVWQASGSGQIGDPDVAGNLFSGDYDSVTVDTGPDGSGSFAGFFTQGADAAGLSYQLQNADRTINGVAAFEAKQP